MGRGRGQPRGRGRGGKTRGPNSSRGTSQPDPETEPDGERSLPKRRRVTGRSSTVTPFTNDEGEDVVPFYNHGSSSEREVSTRVNPLALITSYSPFTSTARSDRRA